MSKQHSVSVGTSYNADRFLQQPYARIILPDMDGTFRGEILEFPGCISTGETAAEALSRLEDVARDWLFAALEAGQNIPQPFDNNNDFSGRLVLRLPKSLHKKASWIAEREGVSLNQLIVASIAENIGERTKSAGNMAFTTIQLQYLPTPYMAKVYSTGSGIAVGVDKYITTIFTNVATSANKITSVVTESAPSERQNAGS